MPSVHPPASVLITGASGFIGSWITRTFLERGYNVRGTVRSMDKGEWFSKQDWVKAAPGKFEYRIVPEIDTPGAFDEAVKEVDAVVHSASPAILVPTGDPHETLINPAVNGTLEVLNSVLKTGSAVKRVVVTSSIAAVEEPTMTRRVFTENDWNNFTLKEIEKEGCPPIEYYRASKLKAEQVVWNFMEQNKGRVNFEATTILPCIVYGPITHDVPSLDKLNVSLKIFYDHVRNKAPLDVPLASGNYVDVRDVAALHVDVVETDKAAGQRFLANAGPYTWQGVYDALNSHANPLGGVPVGTPGAGKTVFHPTIFGNEKSKTVLGFKYRTVEEMSYDTLSSFKERGLW